MAQPRSLVVVADDFGIGPHTSAGILELASRGLISGTVLLVNSPFAAESVQAWHDAGRPLEMGWHPCLTLDAPILPPEQVPTLVNRHGRFYSLGQLIKRLFLGRLARAELEAELQAQYRRFCELVGQPPRLINTHHHVAVFPLVGDILLDVLKQVRPLPYVRRVREPWRLLWQIPGARAKRAFLNSLGRVMSHRQETLGFPGNDWLIGITDPPCVTAADFFVRWLERTPGQVVELTCHPGRRDLTLLGRDALETDGMVQRRVDEMALLMQPSFRQACMRAGFQLVSPFNLVPSLTSLSHAA